MKRYLHYLAKSINYFILLITSIFLIASTNLIFGQITLNKTTIPQNTCNRFDVTLEITGVSSPAPIDVILVIDRSGSMSDGSPSSMSQAKTAAINFVRKTFSTANNPSNFNRVGIVSYSTNATENIQLSYASDSTLIISEINNMVANGYTNIADGFYQAYKEMKTRGRTDCNVLRAIVLLTDGVSNYGSLFSAANDRWEGNCTTTPITANQCTNSTYLRGQESWTFTVGSNSYENNVYTVGLFGGISGATQTLASDVLNQAQNSGYYETETAANLNGIYSQIFDQLQWVAKAIPGIPMILDTISNGFSIIPGTLTVSKDTAIINGNVISWDIGYVNNETLTLKYSVSALDSVSCGFHKSSNSWISYQNSACLNMTQTFQNSDFFVPCTLTITAITEQISCNNANDGSITATSNGGTGSYSFSLNGGLTQSSNVFSGLASGSYSIIVYDENNCSATIDEDSLFILNPPLLTASDYSTFPISCFNSSDGSITINAVGGTGSYLYSLNGGGNQSQNVFSGLIAGSYLIMVFDANGCSTSLNANPIVITSPLAVTASATASSQASCFDATDGVVTVSANGGTGNYSYSLNGDAVQSSNIFSGLISGSYSVEVFDANSCSATTNTMTIANPALLTASATASSQVSCFDASDGVVTVSAYGGTGDYSYSLNGGVSQSSNVFSGLIAGNYSVEVFDANNCSATTNINVISNPASLTASATASSQVSCFDASDGVVTVSANGGTGDYGYSLNGGTVQSSNIFSGLIAGTYSVEVFDVNNCSALTNTTIIANPALLTASATASSQVSCFDANDGVVTVMANGGTGDYSYSLNGGAVQSSNIFSGLIAGSYSVEVFDANNCSATTNVNIISNPALLNASATASSQVSCFDAADGVLTVSANGGTGNYSYSLNGGAVQSSNVFSGLIAGTYSVEVFDANGCSALTNTTIIANPALLTASATASIQVSCFDAADGVVTVTANGGTGDYSYSLNGGAAQSSNIFLDLISGSYSVEVFDVNNCSATTSTMTIANPALLSASATASSQVSCFDSADGVVTVSANGGTGDYSYSLNGGVSQSSNVFSGLVAGNYSVEVFDANGCSATTNTTIIANPALLSASATASSQVSCFDAADGVVTVSAYGGTGDYSYSLNGGVSQSSNVFSGLVAGTYSVEVFDANSCSATTNVNIIANPALLTASATASSQVSCFDAADGVVTVSANGGTGDYSYSLNGAAVQSSNIFSGLIAGTYSVEVFDANNCSATTNTMIIANPALLTAYSTASSQVSCFDVADGLVTVTANGGTGDYSYSLNGGTLQSSNVFSGLIAGTYSVEVFDANNCSATTNTTIIANPALLNASATASSQVSCFDDNDGLVTVSANGGTSDYSYSLNGGTLQSSNVFSGLVAGSYSIEVFDANNCSATTNTMIIANPTLLTASATVSSQASCFDTADGVVTVSANGGTGDYSYSLNGGAVQISNVFSGLIAGTYSVEVFDVNGCSALTNANVFANPALLTASATASSQVSCFDAADGVVTVSANGGTGDYSYSLNGGTVQSSNIFSGLIAGNYSVEVFDANNCSAITNTMTIANPAVLTASTTASSQVSCFDSADGVVTVSANGGTGDYSYSLNGGTLQSSNVFSGLIAGTYSVEVFDANSCSATTNTMTIANPALLTTSATASSQVACFDAADGVVTVSANGGTGDYSYSLNGGVAQSSNIFSGLISGSYSVEVFDVNGCLVTTNYVVIANPALLTASATASSQVSCFDSADGVVTVTANGGTGYYSYSLNGGAAQSLNIFSGLISGTYSVEVFDVNGCSAITNTNVIANPTLLTASTTASSQVSCFDSADGVVTVSANGGTGDYSYSLNGGVVQSSNVFSGLIAGNYSVEVFDANNCSALTNANVIANPALLTASANASSQVSCFDTNDGVVTVSANGGTGDYSYSLNGAAVQSSNIFSGLIAGTYSVEVFDANNCSTLTNAVIIENQQELKFEASQIFTGCNGSNSGIINIDVASGTFPYIYSIDGGLNYSNSNKFNYLPAGTYNIIVKDANNCTSTLNEFLVQEKDELRVSVNIISENKCYGKNDASVEIDVVNGESPFKYIVDNVEFNSNIISNVASGYHDVIVTDKNNCLATNDFNIENRNPINVDLVSYTDANCVGKYDGSIKVEAYGGTGEYEYIWSNGMSSNYIYGLDEGIYVVTVTDLNSCSVVFEKSVAPGSAEYEIDVKNSFSPNSDGINDKWEVKNLEFYPDNQLIILNRWGNEIYTQNRYSNDWDGSNLAEGTYYYILKVNMCGDYKKLDGYITILR